MDSLAQSQIELNKLYGRRLVIIAWVIEIIAASLGLAIGVINALSTIEYYQNLDESVIIGTTFTNVFVAAAPFVIIAAVELTKIPLALGFYRTKRLSWRLLFLTTLSLLVFVTFETMFNGLERQFSGLESGIEESRNNYQQKMSQMKSIEQRLGEIDQRTVEKIEEEYQEKISLLQKEFRDDISELRQEEKGRKDSVRNDRQLLIENFNVVATTAGAQQRSDNLRKQISNLKTSTLSQINEIRDQADERLENIDIAIQQLNEKETQDLLNSWALGRGTVRAAAKEQREIRVDEKNQVLSTRDDQIIKLEEERDNQIVQLQDELRLADEELSKSQGRDSGNLEQGLEGYKTELEDITSDYGLQITNKNMELEQAIEDLLIEKENIQNIQRTRENSRPEYEEEQLQLREDLISIRSVIDDKANQINVYRIAEKIFSKNDDGTKIESAADLESWQISMVQYIWFGSIALVAALVGTIIALAGFVLQDPESYRPVLNRKKPLQRAIRGVFLRLRAFYKTRRTGVLRRSFRALVVDMRRRFRAPKIKYKEVKVPHEVVKEVQVPGPEKVVYKEVPKEIVKSEIVYVPLYSVEEGTVLSEKDKYKTPKLDDE